MTEDEKWVYIIENPKFLNFLFFQRNYFFVHTASTELHADRLL